MRYSSCKRRGRVSQILLFDCSPHSYVIVVTYWLHPTGATSCILYRESDPEGYSNRREVDHAASFSMWLVTGDCNIRNCSSFSPLYRGTRTVHQREAQAGRRHGDIRPVCCGRSPSPHRKLVGMLIYSRPMGSYEGVTRVFYEVRVCYLYCGCNSPRLNVFCIFHRFNSFKRSPSRPLCFVYVTQTSFKKKKSFIVYFVHIVHNKSTLWLHHAL